MTPRSNEEARFFEILKLSQETSGDPFVKVKTLVVGNDGRYKLYALCHPIDTAKIGLPEILCQDKLPQFDKDLADLALCKGNNDDKHIELLKKRKGVIKNKTTTTAYLDTTLEAGLEMADIPKGGTVRHRDCTILVNRQEVRCGPCRKYTSTLQKLTRRQISSTYHSMYKK